MAATGHQYPHLCTTVALQGAGVVARPREPVRVRVQAQAQAQVQLLHHI